MKYKMQTAKLKAGPLTYFSGGKSTKDAEGKEHLPILYLHGADGLAKTRVHEALAADRRLFMPVVPGLDGTDTVPGIDSMPKLADFIADFVKKKLGGKCDLWGYSFGGRLACWLAATHPELVDVLVLENSGGVRPPGVPPMPTDPKEVFRRVYKYPEKRLPDDRPEAVVHGNAGKVAHYHGGVPHDVEMIKRLKDIAAPTLILYGDEEEMSPIETVRVLSDAIPRHFVIYMADAKHSIQVDQPERMTRLVRDFFNRGEAFIVRQQAAE